MANVLRNTGFRPWGQPLRATLYQCGLPNVFVGDLLQVNSSGQVSAWSSSANPSVGVCAQFQNVQGQPVLVWDHPDQQFLAQTDGTAVVSSVVNTIGMNATVTANSGNNQYKVSRMQILANSLGTTTTFPLKVIAVDQRPDNALGSSYVDLICFINNHIYKGGTGTAGI